MADKELKKWKCDACAESEGGSGLPCIITSELQPEMLKCPVSGDDCDWYESNTRYADTELVDALKNALSCIEALSIDLGDEFEEKWEWTKGHAVLAKHKEKE